MIVDTSALLAVLLGEEEGGRMLEMMVRGRPMMSAATRLEAAIVLDARRNPVLSRKFDELLQVVAMRTEPVTVEQVAVARQAYRDFGRGSGHPAKLNLGDCFTYALAAVTGAPLLYKGDDFVHTDLRSALGPVEG